MKAAPLSKKQEKSLCLLIMCLLRAVIAVQNDNRLRYFVYCPARASVTVIVHRTRVQNAPHNSDADACAPKYYSTRARAYTHIMRMHTYTRAYAIYIRLRAIE